MTQLAELLNVLAIRPEAIQLRQDAVGVHPPEPRAETVSGIIIGAARPPAIECSLVWRADVSVKCGRRRMKSRVNVEHVRVVVGIRRETFIVLEGVLGIL